MEKYQAIYNQIERATDSKVVLKKGVSKGAILMLFGGCALSAGGFALQISSIALTLHTAALALLILGVVKLLVGTTNYVYLPTNCKLKKVTTYFAPGSSNILQSGLEEKKFENIASLEKRDDMGVKVDAMYSKDYKFAAVQLSEYIPYEYEPITEVHCYYDEDAARLIENIQ